MLIKNIQYIITQNASRDILEHTDIRIENGHIVEIGNNLDGETTIDGSHLIIMPGLINCHTHVGMQKLRGLCDDEELKIWLDKVINAEGQLTDTDIEAGTKNAIQEMLTTGTTTFCEMFTPLDPILKAVQDTKIRAVLCETLHAGRGDPKTHLNNARARIESWKANPRISLGLGPHSIYLTPPDILQAAHSLATEQNLLFHIHLAETRAERVQCHHKTGKLPLQYLQSLNILDEHTLLAHCIWLTKEEVRTIGETKAAVAHCPTSNMKLAGGGVMPLMEMWDANVSVGLGTDSVASNNSLNLFDEMKICGLLHKHHRWNPKEAPVQRILDMATIEAAHALRLTDRGSIETDKVADMVALNTSTTQLYPLSKDTILSHLVYANAAAAISWTMVGGELVYKQQ